MSSAFGIKTTNSKDASQKKVGVDRIGSDEISANFGITLILGSFIFLLLITLVIIAILISRRVHLAPKIEKAKEWLKRKLFYNPMIRYAFLNALKINMAAILAFKLQSEEAPSILVSALLFIVMTAIPVILAYILY